MILFCVILSLFSGVYSQEGARLLFPPPRNFLLQQGYSLNEAALNCGGVKQWMVNGGRCGVCGDSWDEFRKNEIIEEFPEIFMVDRSAKSKKIKLLAELPSKGRGYIEVRLCESMTNQLSQKCFDENLLFIEEANSNRYKVGKETQVVLTLLLPETVICEKCVLQWKYVKGNKKCHKCQETFINCADIALVDTRKAKAKSRVKRQLSQPFQGAPGLAIPTTVPKENIHWIGDKNLKGHIPPQSVLSKDMYVSGNSGIPETHIHSVQKIKSGATDQNMHNQQIGVNTLSKPTKAPADYFGSSGKKLDNIIGALSMLHADPSAATFPGSYPAILTENSLGRMRSKEDILMEAYRKMAAENINQQQLNPVEPVSPGEIVEPNIRPELPEMQFVVDPGVTRQRIFTIKPTVPTFSMRKHLKARHFGSRSHATPRFKMNKIKTINSLSNLNDYKLSTNRVFKPTKTSTTRVNAPATRAFRWATRQANSLSVSVSGKPPSITKPAVQTNQQPVQTQQNTPTVIGSASVNQPNTMINNNLVQNPSQHTVQGSVSTGQQTGPVSNPNAASVQNGQQQRSSANTQTQTAQSSNSISPKPMPTAPQQVQQVQNNMNQNVPTPQANYMGITDITKVLSPSSAPYTGGNHPTSLHQKPNQTPHNTHQTPNQGPSMPFKPQHQTNPIAAGNAQVHQAQSSTGHSSAKTSNSQVMHQTSNTHTAIGSHSTGKHTPSLLENMEKSLKVLKDMGGKGRNALYVVKSSKDVPKVIQTLEMNKTKKKKQVPQVEQAAATEQYPSGNEQMLNIKYDTGFSGGRNIPLYVVQTEPKYAHSIKESKSTVTQTESKLTGTGNVLPQTVSKSSMIPPNPPPKQVTLTEPSNIQSQNSVSKTVVNTQTSNILYEKPVEPIPQGVKLAGIPDPISSNIVIPKSSQVSVPQNKYPTNQPSGQSQVIAGAGTSGMEVTRPSKMTTLDAILWGVNTGKSTTGTNIPQSSQSYQVSPGSTTRSKPKSKVMFSARRSVFSPGKKAVFSFGYRNKQRTFSGSKPSVFKMPRMQTNEVGNQINQIESKTGMKTSDMLNKANKDLMPSQGQSFGGSSLSLTNNAVMDKPSKDMMTQQGQSFSRPSSNLANSAVMSKPNKDLISAQSQSFSSQSLATNGVMSKPNQDLISPQGQSFSRPNSNLANNAAMSKPNQDLISPQGQSFSRPNSNLANNAVMSKQNQDLISPQGQRFSRPNSNLGNNAVMSKPNQDSISPQGQSFSRQSSSFANNAGMTGAMVMTGYQGMRDRSSMPGGTHAEAGGVNMVSSGLSQSQSKQVQVLTSSLSASGQYSIQDKQKQASTAGNFKSPNLFDSSVIVPEKPKMPADGRTDQAGLMVSEPMVNQLSSSNSGQLSSSNTVGKQTHRFFEGNPEIVVSHSEGQSSQPNPIQKSKVLWSSGVSKTQAPNIIYREQSNPPTNPTIPSDVNPTKAPSYPSFSFAGLQSTAMATKVPFFKAVGTTGPRLLETRDYFSRTPIQKVINIKRPSFSFGSKSRNHSPKISYRNSFSVQHNQKMTKAPLNMTPTGKTMMPTTGPWNRVK